MSSHSRLLLLGPGDDIRSEKVGRKLQESNEIEGLGILSGPIEKLPTINDLVMSLSENDNKHLSTTLGEEISPDEAEELSAIFPEDIPKALVEKHTTTSRIKQLLLIPKKLQHWRRKE